MPVQYRPLNLSHFGVPSFLVPLTVPYFGHFSFLKSTARRLHINGVAISDTPPSCQFLAHFNKHLWHHLYEPRQTPGYRSGIPVLHYTVSSCHGGVVYGGIAYRYRTMSEYDEQFTLSTTKFGKSPLDDERYNQEKALFGFLIDATSTTECFFYSTYCVASILKPSEFPISDGKTLKRLYPQEVAQEFQR